MLIAAYIVVAVAVAYLATGIAVGLVFLLGPIEQREPGSRGSYAFRALLLPGMALLWPLVLHRWRAPAGPQANLRHRRWHGGAWLVAAVVLALVLVAALAQRGPAPPEPSSIRIGAIDGRVA